MVKQGIGKIQGADSFKRYFPGFSFVYRVKFVLNPFDTSAGNCRHLYAEMLGSKWKDTNPNCKVEMELLAKSDTNSHIQITYINNYRHKFDARTPPQTIFDRMKWTSAFLDGAGCKPAHEPPEETFTTDQ
eukprot:CAMPEP_0175093616 /NCGR_PEP_ID=MMETSP0086_2-20121207/3120_1 /TAXON_ID=136419 /ORGANISM="Unknown Unknown, Strain D1" /LENGTH=129 /DNA_ID=CAMNT_0016366615 /DNA_START=63 /DNA_END=452 /DNA_ORIENTATION=+